MPINHHKGDKWPPKVSITIYGESDDGMYVYEESKDSKFDLSDNLPFHLHTVFLGIETLSKNWPVWDEESLKLIEELIEFDLHFDGNEVFITRTTEQIGQSCSEEFIWRLDLFEGELSPEQKQRAEFLAGGLRKNGLDRGQSLELAYAQVLTEESPYA